MSPSLREVMPPLVERSDKKRRSRLTDGHFCPILTLPTEQELRDAERSADPEAPPVGPEGGLEIEVDKTLGKGSHYRVRFGGRVTTVQDGDLSPMHIRRICEQVGIDPAEL